MKSGSDRKNTFVKLNNKFIWIVKVFEVVAEAGTRIGNPVPLDPAQFLNDPVDQGPKLWNILL